MFCLLKYTHESEAETVVAETLDPTRMLPNFLYLGTNINEPVSPLGDDLGLAEIAEREALPGVWCSIKNRS